IAQSAILEASTGTVSNGQVQAGASCSVKEAGASCSVKEAGASKMVSARLLENYGKLPVRFEQNEGQTPQVYRYVARGYGYTMLLKSDGIVMAMTPPIDMDKKATHNKRSHKRSDSFFTAPGHSWLLTVAGTDMAETHKVDILRIKFAGMDLHNTDVNAPELTATDALEGKSNYLIGNSKEKWLTNVTAYRRVKYTNLYPGIDLVLYGNQKEIEYDFVVQPKADLRKIALKVNGTMSIKTNKDGSLVFKTHGGYMLMRKPKIYQEIDGEQKTVSGTYVIKNNRLISFKVANYNRKLPLVIDPVFQYSTYLGGSSGDQALAIAVDTLGSAYVAGRTISLDFPTVNPYRNSSSADYYDVFVSKFSKDGSSLVYSTYIGGSLDDEARGIAVDTNGSAYITGSTHSQDFPIVNAFQSSIHGWVDAFVTKLSSNGTTLLYSTYLGGTANDEANAIAVDSGGNAFITGYTYSTDFPTNNAYQSTISGVDDAFVTKLSSSGTYIPYSTYLGGTLEDEATGIAVDVNGNAYITGFTSSTNFPTTASPLQAIHGGGTYDAFITKLSATGSPQYSTYVGGNGSDRANGIAVDTAGNVYITGSTTSTNYPTTSTAMQSALKGMTDAFVTKIISSGSSLGYSTYLGGSDIDAGMAIAVDKAGNIYVAGETASTDFPTLNPYKKNNSGFYDAFMARLTVSADSYNLQLSTYLGGSADDKATAIAVDQRGDAYICGQTASSNFPTVHPLQKDFHNPVSNTDIAVDAFVTKVRFKLYHDDFNADGMSDILWQNTATGQLFIWLMNGTNIYSGDSPAIVNDPNWQYRGKGDFNGDGKSDILWQNTTTSQFYIWFMDGAKIQSAASLATMSDKNWQLKGFGDFNSDGNTDILWQNSSSGEVIIWFIDGSNIVNTASLGSINVPWQINAVADFNGDGKSDILWQNTTTGQLAIWFIDGSQIATVGSLVTVSDPSWQIRATADFNGDGKSDILWQNTTTGQFYVWYIDGTQKGIDMIIGGGYLYNGTDPLKGVSMSDPNWQLKAVTDYNNDGMADMLWYNASTGQVYIWIINGVSISSVASGSPANVGANSNWQIK
ncbi:MAG: SBBP repeat-containing protein, partial [Nitrospirae bacterium]|nr:SBBP repeat-containing protein [Nitrospirota bacterium]